MLLELGGYLYAVTYLGFALAKLPWQLWALYDVYDIYYSTTEGIVESSVLYIINERNRGTALGIYNISVGF
ncbi:MAG: MFS transporter [Clostridiaceae bacterium]|nr:MFS transporter [Clostridiaceae bacterium]